MELLLFATKIFGLILATAATIYGLTHEIYTTTDDGERLDKSKNKKHTAHQHRKPVRRPTPASTISIAFTIFGLFISVITALLENVEKKQDELSKAQISAKQQQDQAAIDLHNTQEIILAGQPFLSLELAWTFHHVASQLLTEASDADIEGNNLKSEQRREDIIGLYEPHTADISAVMAEDLRYNVVYPFLNVLAGGTWNNSRVVAIFGLDASSTSVLPISLLDYSPELKNAPGAADFVQDMNSQYWSHLSRSREAAFDSKVRIQGNDLTLVWHFGVGQLDKVIDLAVPDVRRMARFRKSCALCFSARWISSHFKRTTWRSSSTICLNSAARTMVVSG